MSDIWKYFVRLNELSVQCKLCNHLMRYNGSTSNMWRHAKMKHTFIRNDIESSSTSEAKTQEIQVMEQNAGTDTINETSSTKPTQRKITELMNMSVKRSCTIENETGTSTPKSRRVMDESVSQEQPKITDIFVSKSVSSKRQQTITEALAQMIAIDMLPVSFIEGEGFKLFMNTICPTFKIPSRSTIVSRIDLLYDTEKVKLTKHIESNNFWALTTDCWTSRSNESYITVSIHGISDTWEFVHYNLTTEEMIERHTAENLKTKLDDIISDFKLNGKIVAVVHDNAINIKNAVKMSEEIEESVCCFAHTLQLAINKGLDTDAIKQIISKCSSLVSHFKHSTLATNALKLKQSQLGIVEHKLIQSVRTRWNSTFYMIDRLLEQREPIMGVVNDRNITTRSNLLLWGLNESDWEVMEQLKTLLHPFEIATKLMSADKYSTISMVQPIVQSLLNNFVGKTNREDLQIITTFKKTVEGELKSRFNFNFTPNSSATNIFDICTFLDPRFKNKERIIIGINTKVKRFIDGLIEVHPSKALYKNLENTDTTTALDILFPGESSNSAVVKETEIYSAESEILKNATVSAAIQWWKSNESRFPVLAQIVKQYLCIPATSTASERAFSTAGHIVNAKRACLTTDHVKKLTFLSINLKNRM